MSRVEPLQESNVIKTLGLKEGEKRHDSNKRRERRITASEQQIATHRREVAEKRWKEQTEAKTLTKCIPYCLFPWAGTDAFARGRPPTQSNTRHRIDTQWEKDGWLFIESGKVPRQIGGGEYTYIFCLNHLHFQYVTAAALTVFGLMSGCHHRTAMSNVSEKEISRSAII